jgi:PAS domain S-box-containing protein
LEDHHGKEELDAQVVNAPPANTPPQDPCTSQDMLDHLPLGVMLADRSGQVVYANECAATMSGYSVEELKRGAWLRHPDNSAAGELFNRACSELTPGSDNIVRLVRKDDSVLWASLSWRAAADFEGSGGLVQLVLTDVTACKLAEEALADALRESDKRYRGLVESQKDLIVRVDPEGRFTFVNEGYLRMFGKSPEDLIGSSFVPLVHEDDLPHTLAALELLKSPPYRCRVEQRAWTVDGWRWLSWEDCAIMDENGEMIEIQAIGHDINDLKNAYDTMQRSEMRLRTLVSNIPGAVYRTCLNRDWTMEFISDAIEGISGYPSDDFVDSSIRTYASVIHPEDEMMVWEGVRERVLEKQPFAVEYRLVHADGSIRWVLDKGQAVFSDKDEPLWLDGIIFDITARKNAEEELRRAYDIQREFLNNITHEVRTPLTAVQGYVQMLMEGTLGPVSKEQATLLKRVLASSDHLLSIVSGVLEIARAKSGAMQLQPQVCNPSQIVDKAISAVMPQATEKGLYVNVELPAVTQSGMYDEHKLTIILTNLLTNAVKFAKSGGVDVELICNRHGIEIIVSDTGPGIDQSDIELIFDEFAQFDRPKKHKPSGFGIGLAIVATMIEVIQGSLTVSSKPGIGTAFTLRAPKLEQQ